MDQNDIAHTTPAAHGNDTRTRSAQTPIDQMQEDIHRGAQDVRVLREQFLNPSPSLRAGRIADQVVAYTLAAFVVGGATALTTWLFSKKAAASLPGTAGPVST